jgi:hypothetical protein
MNLIEDRAPSLLKTLENETPNTSSEETKKATRRSLFS